MNETRPMIDFNGMLRQMTEEEVAEQERIAMECPEPPIGPVDQMQEQIDELTLIVSEMLAGGEPV